MCHPVYKINLGFHIMCQLILTYLLSQAESDSSSASESESEDDEGPKEPKGAVAKYLVSKAKTPEEVKIILTNEKKAEKQRKDRKAAKRKEDSKAAQRKNKETAAAKKASAAAKKAKQDEKEIKVFS